MDAYTHEKEQIDQIVAWWKENWLFIVSGVVIAVGGLSGWRAYEAYQLERAEAASAQYEELAVQVAARNFEQADSILAMLKSDYGSTVYAPLAAMKRAEIHVSSNELPAAANELRWAMNSGVDREIQLLARVRLARVLLASDDAAAALTVANGVARPGKFQSSFDEISGDAHYLMGDIDAARDSYESARASAIEGAGDASKLQRKIENLQMPVDAIAVSNEAAEAGAAE